MSSTSSPILPSILAPSPAYQDATTTPQQLQAAQSLSKVTTPEETPIYICALQNCYRLFARRELLMRHRKAQHNTEDESEIITWHE